MGITGAFWYLGRCKPTPVPGDPHAMKAQARSVVETFAPARSAFEDLIAQLTASAQDRRTHSVVEELLHVHGFEVLRLLYQAHLDLRAAEDRRQADARTER